MLSGVLVAAIAACHGRAAPISCSDDLRGVYRDGAERWMILDGGATLEAYPLFPDADGPADLVTAPRRIDLARPAGGAAPSGTLHRRYMRGAASCDARVAVHVTRCAGDAIELVVADALPPLGFEPCAWPAAAPSRLVRWRRE